MYKIIFIDLDGTLLNNKKEVSRENIEMIHRAYKEKGVICVVTTGRAYVCAKHIAEIVGEGCLQYIVASNGSVIRDCKKSEYLNRQSISNESTIKCLEMAKKYGFMSSVDILTKIITNEKIIDKERFRRLGLPYEQIEKVETYFKENQMTSENITVAGNRNKLIKFKEELKEIKELEPTELCKTSRIEKKGEQEENYIDIMKKGVSKQKAIQVLCEHLKIKKEEIMVIGDGGNDIPMFEVAGLKIAMANGLDSIKQRADYVTVSNNESGVAKAIEKFIFTEK